MVKTKKIYDYNVEKVKSRLVTTFKKRKNESTIADLIAATGLPKHQVEQTSKVILDEYAGHLKVTESGEILYYFPHGMKSRIHGFIPGLKRFFKSFLSVMGKILSFLFKIWIMVMLVGYFILFLLILIVSIVAALAASGRSSSRSRSRGSGGLFFLVIRLIELFLRIFFWVQLTKSPTRKRGRPFYKSVFGYVFGDIDPNKEWEEKEKVAVISYIRTNKGVITNEELMVLTGKNYDGVQQLINSYLLEFEGEPMVTDNGTIIYFFPELLRSRKEELLTEAVTLSDLRYKSLIPFANNKKKTNVWITVFNTFNLSFGSYFLIYSLLLGSIDLEAGLGFLYLGAYYLFEFIIANPAIFIFIGLGIIPFSFSILFFLIPIVRRIRLNKRNETIKKENLRKKVYSNLIKAPLQFDPKQIAAADKAESPKNANDFIKKELDRLAAIKNAEFESKDDGTILYNFTELQRELQDVAQYRAGIDLSKYEVGETVFDSGQ